MPLLSNSREYKKRELLTCLFLFIAALIPRLVLLDVHPPGLWYDEAINGLDALSMIKDGPKIFFTTENHPREPLYMYFIAFFYLFLPPTIFVLRAVSGILGALTIPAVYGLIRRISRDRKLALVSAIILLFMRWHIHHSRLALRAVLVPLWFTLVLWAFCTAVDRKSKKRWALAGVIFGLGSYTHLAFRFAPFVFLFPLIYYLKKGMLQFKRDSHLFGIFLLSAFLVFLPLGIDYLLHPFHFFGRMKEVSLFGEGIASGISTIVNNVVAVILMFSFKGDQNPLLNLPGAPVFHPLYSVFFYLGVITCIVRFRRSVLPIMMFSWMTIMFLPTILSSGAPHFARSLGASVPAAVFVSVGIVESYEWFYDFFRNKAAVLITVIVIIVGSSWNIHLYFMRYRGNMNLWNRSNAAWVQCGRKALSISEEGNVVYLPTDMYYHPSVKYVMLNKKSRLVCPLSFPECLTDQFPETAMDHVILTTSLNRLLPLLKKEIPSGVVISVAETPEGMQYGWFYLIPERDLMTKEEAASFTNRYNPPEHY